MNTTKEGWTPGTLSDVTERFRDASFVEAFTLIAEEINDLHSEMAYIREPDYAIPNMTGGDPCKWFSLTGFDDHIPFGLAKWEPSPGCLLIHNHPSKLPPSRSDVEFLFWKPRSRVIVLGDLPYHLASTGRIVTTADVSAVLRMVHLTALSELSNYRWDSVETAYAMAWWHSFRLHASDLGVIIGG